MKEVIKNEYFGQEVHEALIKYKYLSCYPTGSVFSCSFSPIQVEQYKEKVFNNVLKPAFDKLSEYLINVYKFYQMDEDIENLKHDCTCFLLGNISKFDEQKGTKAFSYFNQIAKNYLIQLYYKHKKKMFKEFNIDDINRIDEDNQTHIKHEKIIDTSLVVKSDEDKFINNLSGEFFQLVKENLPIWRDKTRNNKEKKVLNALIIIFDNYRNIDIQKQKTLILYIKEITGFKKSEIRFALNRTKNRFLKLRKNYFED